MGKESFRVAKAAAFLWRRICDISTVAWLWSIAAAVVAAVLAALQNLPLAVWFIFAIGAFALTLIAIHLWRGLKVPRETFVAAPPPNANEPYSPILFAGLVEAKDAPEKDHTALRVVVRNNSDQNLTGLVARLVGAEPDLGSLNAPAINLPLVLETKARLDRLRNPKIGELPPQQGFDLHAGSEKQIEVVWLHSKGAIEGCITHQDGEESILFVGSQDFRIEVTGAGMPITAVLRINVDNDDSQSWKPTLIVEAAGAAHGQGSVGQKP